MRRQIFITTSFEACHWWGDAPEQVKFLSASHRHIFHVKVCIEVGHSDREIEFILFKRMITDYVLFKYNLKDLGQKSCEMIAEDIHFHLVNMLSVDYKRPMTIEVSEDGENGAILTWD